MIAAIKAALRMLTPAQVAADELQLAELELLTAYSAREHAVAVITYNEARCKRLRAFLAKLEK